MDASNYSGPGIYEIECVTGTYAGWRYVGSAKDVAWRWKCHLQSLHDGNSNRHLQAAFKEVGTSGLSFRLVTTCPAHLLLTEEQAFIDSGLFKFNISPTAGSCLGVKRTEEFKEKISTRMRGRKRPDLAAALTGKKLSPEHIENLSAAMRGNKNSLGHKNALKPK